MTILHIESSTTICSVAVSHNNSLIFEQSDNEGMNHAKLLSPFTEEALQKIKEQSLTLDAIAVSSGPGSYTGLRIGASTAKGLCYGFDIPLIAIPTLDILVQAAIYEEKITGDSALFPMIDARRMEVYTARYQADGTIQDEVYPEIVNENSFAKYLDQQICYFFGNGAEKCIPIIIHPNARFLTKIHLSAAHMIPLAEKKFKNRDFADVAYFEPFYLKEFQATIPKKMF